jgi:hypothetical protein
MKKYFSLCMLLLSFGAFNFANAQCLKPSPMTPQQVQAVKGQWKGSYTHNGSPRELVINISALDSNVVICEINNPPIPGKEADVEYFFCPGGEFHLRKYIGDSSFVFQATPVNNTMKGMVSVYDNKNKRKKTGDFVLAKTD